MNLFGFEVKVIFLLSKNSILAYAWHYTKEKARKHLMKIMDFHNLNGDAVESKFLENWLEKEVKKVVLQGSNFNLPNINYRYKEVYNELIKIPRSKAITYTTLYKRVGIKYKELLMALMRNPFQILVPCHRLISQKGTLMGFYPLGIDVKKKLLKLEEIKW